MNFVRPLYTREQVNAAGKTLVRYAAQQSLDMDEFFEYEQALPVISNWRSSHSYPLNTFAVTLRAYARKVDDGSLIAQRIKRLSSIEAKLGRFPSMKLSQMQDIGGCRAVLRDVAAVDDLVAQYRHSSIKHERASFDDYITTPQSSGYRGVHLVYRYFSDKRKRYYNGLKIEIQLRSLYQHAWATAVETVGTFVHQALKSSSGEPEWLRFFSLMGTAIANRERRPQVPGTPKDVGDLRAELQQITKRLHVAERLQAYGEALRTLRGETSTDSRYYLLVLDPTANQLRISGFSDLDQASDRYLEAEKAVRDNPGTDAVLVSVDSLAALERAYPNYFADTRVFLQLLEQSLRGQMKRVKFTPRPHDLDE